MCKWIKIGKAWYLVHDDGHITMYCEDKPEGNNCGAVDAWIWYF